MYFVVSKLTFEAQPTSYDARELSQLVDKLRNRFKISVQVSEEFHRSGTAALMVAAVHSQEEHLSKLIDDIADACENSGFGRINSENTILEDFEAFNEEYE
ncbi:MAG: DUF503 family protein [Oligoflexus sp.]|jgi:hypothetical protein